MSEAITKELTKEQRLEAANALLEVIGDCGRGFFKCEGKRARLSLDESGRVWLKDDYTGKDINTLKFGDWIGFSHGGTLKGLIESLRDFIVTGVQLNHRNLGPWPQWLCDGDLWGYGKDMETVREAARQLSIIEAQAEGVPS
jgi:hypothetical protein